MEKKHITVEIIQKTLKELKLNSLYKYIYFIYSKVTDIVPVIDEEKEKELYSVFARVQDSFNRLKQTGALGRKNIWVYRYCVYKICEIIEESFKNISKNRHQEILIKFSKKKFLTFLWRNLSNLEMNQSMN